MVSDKFGPLASLHSIDVITSSRRILVARIEQVSGNACGKRVRVSLECISILLSCARSGDIRCEGSLQRTSNTKHGDVHDALLIELMVNLFCVVWNAPSRHFLAGSSDEL